jgi:RNA-binding protein
MTKRLTGSQRTYLRGLAHHLNPIVQVGKEGLTEPVFAALDTALSARELIKVRLPGDRDDRRAAAAAIDARLGSECVGLIGGVAILYRAHPDPEARRVHLPS